MGKDKIQIMHCVVKVSSVDIIVTIFDVVANVIQTEHCLMPEIET